MYDKKIQDKALTEGLKNYPKKVVGHRKTLFEQNATIDGNEGKRVLFMHGYMESSQEYESLPKIHGVIASCGTLLVPDYNIPETGRVLKEAGFRPGDKFEFLIRKL